MAMTKSTSESGGTTSLEVDLDDEKSFIDHYDNSQEALEEPEYIDDSPSTKSLSIELISFYKQYPVEAARDLLGIELVFTQRCMLNAMWRYPNVAEVLSRGMSKTFILAVYLMLRLLLHSDIVIGVVSSVYRQAQYVFTYVREINNRALANDLSYFQDQIKRFRVDSYETLLETKHASKAFAVPVGDKGDGARGKRCHILLVDEAGSVPSVIVDKIVRAYLNVLPINPLVWGKDKVETNQKIFCSSASYQWHWFYKEVCDYTAKAKESDLYYALMLDYRDFESDPLSPFRVDWNQLKDAKRSTPKMDFRMEYMNFFMPEGQSFFSVEDLREIKKGNPEFSLLKQGREGQDYLIAIDPAETAGGDNFALGVFQLVPEFKSIVPVYLKKWNDGISMESAAIFIRGLQFLFGAKMVVYDTKGGGAEVGKQLTKTDKVDNHLSTGSFPLLCESGKKSNRGLAIVHPVKFSSQLIESMGWDLAYMIEQRRLVYPKHDFTTFDPVFKESSELLGTMAKEIANIQTKASGAYIGFVAKTGKKDFFTIAMMASHYANKFFDGKLLLERKRRSSTCVGVMAGAYL